MPPKAAKTPLQKLAVALGDLKTRQDAGRHVFLGQEFDRYTRQRLVKAGYLKEILKGWYISSSPAEQAGDSTAFYACFHEFIAAYCNHRFDDEWCLGPEDSLLIHSASSIIPRQVTVHSPRASNNVIQLIGSTSMLDYKVKHLPDSIDVQKNGIRCVPLEQALLSVSENFYRSKAVDAKIALAQVKEVSGLLALLLKGNHVVLAGRLAGALRAQNRADDAEQILSTMKKVGHQVTEVNPFEPTDTLVLTRAEHPCASRVREMWGRYRTAVLQTMVVDSSNPVNLDAYLQSVEERHVEDAYHSLSIEGYKVSSDLIKRIADGYWDPESAGTQNDRNAMAAKGYFDTFNQVKHSLTRDGGILKGGNPGEVLRRDHGNWYQALFGPSVEAGLLSAHHLAGYRSGPVYLRNAMHVPPPHEGVREAMPVFFELLSAESSPVVRVVLGHFFFVYIHPYMDGNGRIGRFLMNAMLAAAGLPWTVIRVENRVEYMQVLDQASAHGNIEPFCKFLLKTIANQSA